MSESVSSLEISSNVRRLAAAPPGMVTAHADHPQRGAFEGFIEARFAKAYGARIETHYPLIAGLTHPDGAVLAAAGVRFAETKPLFLERYLDQPIDQALAGAFGRPVVRDEVVEIGSLAADGAATTLDLFTRLANWLALDGRRRIAVATVRPELARLLIHSGFNLRLVGAAAAERLGDEAAQWGSYYDRGPQVFAGEVGCSPVLPQLRQRLEAKGMAREVRRLRRMAS